MGFQKSRADYGVYSGVDSDSRVYLLVFDDDIISAANLDGVARDVKSLVFNGFNIKDLGEARFSLGIGISRNRGKKGLSIQQKNYLAKPLSKCKMQEYQSVATPMLTYALNELSSED